MNINNHIKELEEIKKKIFNYDINEAMNRVLNLVEEIYKQVDLLKEEKKVFLNEIIKYINISLENKDYLALSDILEYELGPFLLNIDQEVR